MTIHYANVNRREFIQDVNIEKNEINNNNENNEKIKIIIIIY